MPTAGCHRLRESEFKGYRGLLRRKRGGGNLLNKQRSCTLATLATPCHYVATVQNRAALNELMLSSYHKQIPTDKQIPTAMCFC